MNKIKEQKASIFLELVLAISLGINLILWVPRSLASIAITAVFFLMVECVLLHIKKDVLFFKNIQISPLIVSMVIASLGGFGFWRRGTISPKFKSAFNLITKGNDAAFTMIVAAMAIISAIFVYFVICTVRQNEKKEVALYNQSGLSVLDIVLCVFTGSLISLQSDLSPLSTNIPGADSSVFIYIGEMMQKGKIPYVDLFDHKGILLYFIQWLGLEIGNGAYVGIWLFELLSMILFCFAALKLISLFSDTKEVQYGSLFIMFFLCRDLLIYGGNLTEEYALPWITIATYVFIKYFISEKYQKKDIFILGISFAIVFFLRANMITAWIAFMPIVFIKMLGERKWRDLGSCICFFFFGIAVVVIPILTYTIATGSLRGMLQSYLMFNITYSGSDGSFANNLVSAIYILYCLGIGMVFLFCGFFYKKDKIWKLNNWFFVVSFVLASMAGRLYSHYATMLIPALIIPVVQVWETLWTIMVNNKRSLCKVTYASIFAVVLIYVTNFVMFGGELQTNVSNYLKSETSEDADVLVMGSHVSEYLLSKRYSSTPYFYQIPLVGISDKLYKEIYEDFAQREFDVIIIDLGEYYGSYPGSRMEELVDIFEMKGIYYIEEKEDFLVYKKSTNR